MAPQNAEATRQMIAVQLVFILFLACASLCFGEWGQPDKEIAGMRLDQLQKSTKSCDLTSKGREIQVMASQEYMQDLAVRKLQVSASALKDESDKILSEFVRVIELEEQQKNGSLELNKKIRAWLEQNCVDGTLLYLYTDRPKFGLTTGYCLIKDGVVANSFILGEGGLEAGEEPPPNYEIPANLSVTIQAEAVQPIGYPVVLTLTLTGSGKDPYRYWCGGPGPYPSVDDFTAKVTDAEGKEKAITLANGQYTMGSGTFQEIQPGETMDVPASLGLLPVGLYSVQVGSGKTVKVDVKVDPQLAEKRKQELVSGIHQEKPFPQFVGIHYNIKPVIDAFQEDLKGTNLAFAAQAAQAFYGLHPTPDNLVATITTAMQQQLKSTTNDPKRIDLLFTLALLASNIGSDDAMIPVFDLLHSKTSGFTHDQRVTIIGYLSGFKQERATNELHGLLSDTDPEVQTRAAEVLAQRKDSAGTLILRAQMADKSSRDRYGAFLALLEFPDDPQYETMVKNGLDDENSDIRRDAEKAMEQLEKIRKVKNGEF